MISCPREGGREGRLDGVREIPMYSRDGSVRAYTLVDETDAADVLRHRWTFSRGYARRNERVSGRKVPVMLHRQILGLAPGDERQGDHINGDKLDNRRANLRIVTNAQNAQNRGARGGTSRHRNVYWYAARNKWCVQVGLNRRRHYFGYFDTEEAAAEAARAARRQLMPFATEARS